MRKMMAIGLWTSLALAATGGGPGSGAKARSFGMFAGPAPAMAEEVPADVAAMLSPIPAALWLGAGQRQIARPRKILMEVRAYCPCRLCCGDWANVPLSRRRVRDGTVPLAPLIQKNVGFVAAPPNVPMGTLMRIPGYHGGQVVQVLDRGRLVQRNHLDVFMPTHAQALQWGVRRMTVTVYR